MRRMSNNHRCYNGPRATRGRLIACAAVALLLWITMRKDGPESSKRKQKKSAHLPAVTHGAAGPHKDPDESMLTKQKTSTQFPPVTLEAVGPHHLRIFGSSGDGGYEYIWLHQVLLAEMPSLCGSHVTHHDRETLKTMETFPPNSLLFAGGGVRENEWDLLAKTPEATLAQVGLVELSDEGGDHRLDLPIMRKLAFCYRNYFRQDMDDIDDATYLRKQEHDSSGMDAPGKIYWLPLGYGKNTISFPVLNTHPTLRSHLFVFVGNKIRQGREQMVEAVKKCPPQVQELGKMIISEEFNHPTNMQQWEYTSLMYTAVFAFCPAGGNSETFRTWEAFESGALPVLLRNDPQLVMYHRAGLEFAEIDDWTQVTSLLNKHAGDMGPNMSESLQSQIRASRESYSRMKRRMMYHFSRNACRIANRIS